MLNLHFIWPIQNVAIPLVHLFTMVYDTLYGVLYLSSFIYENCLISDFLVVVYLYHVISYNILLVNSCLIWLDKLKLATCTIGKIVSFLNHNFTGDFI